MNNLNKRVLEYSQGGFFDGQWQLDGTTPDEALLGVGTYGHVYGLVSDERDMSTGERQTAALKIIPIDEESLHLSKDKPQEERQLALNKMLREVEDEIAIMQRVKGAANIAFFRDHQKIKRTDTELRCWDVLILMDRLITLDDFLAQSPAKPGTHEYLVQTLHLWRDISSALHVCENIQVIHADIKPANILYHPLHEAFKLGDFGVSIPSGSFKRGISYGTLEYMSPEMYNKEGGDNRSDIYSLAVMIYEMLNGNRLPLQKGSDRKEASLLRLSGSKPIPPIKGVPAEVNRALLKCLERDPKKRYSGCKELEEVVLDLYVTERKQRRKKKEVAWQKPAVIGLTAICIIAIVAFAVPKIVSKLTEDHDIQPTPTATEQQGEIETKPTPRTEDAEDILVPTPTEKPTMNLSLDRDSVIVGASEVTLRGSISVQGAIDSDELLVSINNNSVPAVWEEIEGGYAFTVNQEMDLEGVDSLTVRVSARGNNAVQATQQEFVLPTATPSVEPTPTASPAPAWPLMMSDRLGGKNLSEDEEGFVAPTVLGSDYLRESILSISFANTTSNAPQDAWDVSGHGDKSVLAWVETIDEGKYSLTVAGEGGVRAPESCRYLFADYKNVKTISFNNCFDTSNVTDMYGMFFRCGALEEVDIEGCNTGMVTDMQYMFGGCGSLTSLDVSGFDTSSVTSMQGMFYGDERLTTLDVSKFNTSSTTDMAGMFLGCMKLESLDVSGFDTSLVTNMAKMFEDCSGLEALDVSNFVTSEVMGMHEMFYGCSGLEILDVSRFDTSKVVNFAAMFYDCSRVKELDVSGFNTENAKYMTAMFYGCTIKSLDVSGFDTKNVESLSCMFYNCSGLSSLDLAQFNTQNVTDMSAMFYNCNRLDALDLSSFNTSNVQSMGGMFLDCRSLTTINLSSFDTSKVTDMGGMFMGCSSLKSLDLTSFDTSSLEDASEMFSHCSELATITVSERFELGGGIYQAEMFTECAAKRLTYPDGVEMAASQWPRMMNDSFVNTVLASDYSRSSIVSISFQNHLGDAPEGAWDVSREGNGSVLAWVEPAGDETYNLIIAGNGGVRAPEDSKYLFGYYANVREINFNSCFNTSDVRNMSGMFFGCGAKEIDVSGFDTSKVADMSQMFSSCSALETLDVTSFDTTNVTNMAGMFSAATKLTSIYANDGFGKNGNVNTLGMFTNCPAGNVTTVG